MKKGIGLLIITLAILGAILFVMSRVHHNVMDGYVERSADSFIPENSDVILKENLEGSFLRFSNNLGGVIDENSSAFIKRGLDTLMRRGVLLDVKAERVAIDLETGNFVAAYSSDNDGLTVDILLRCFESMKSRVVRVNDEYPICAIEDSSFFFAESNRWILMSNSSDFIANSLNVVPVRDSVGMAWGREDFDSDAPLNLYVKGNKFDLLLDLLDENLDKSILMQGYGVVNESDWRVALQDQVSRIGYFDENFPMNTISAEWLSLSNLSRFFSSVAKFVKRDTSALVFGNFIQQSDTLLSGDVAQLVCEKNNYILLGIKDKNLIKPILDNVFGDKKTVSLKLSSRSLFGPFFREVNYSVMELHDEFLIMAESEQALKAFSISQKKNLLQQEWYKSYRLQAPTRFSYTQFIYADYLSEIYNDSERGLVHRLFTPGGLDKVPYGALGLQEEYVADRVFLSIVASENAKIKRDEHKMIESNSSKKSAIKPGNSVSVAAGPSGAWKNSISGAVVVGPVKVRNHNTKANEWIVQDSKNKLYLFTNAGKKLWEAPIDGKILSNIEQIDRYKNGKLQYLFSTATKIYLVDRNGVMVSGYPIKLTSKCSEGISLCDYDKDRNYRIFVPRDDRKIDLYDAEGKRVSGWSVPTLTSAPVSPVYHFRVSGKDYIVVADSNKLYIFDRRGNIRVNCVKVFDLKAGTTIVLQQRSGKSVMAVKSSKGGVYFIDFSGKELL